MIAEKVKEIMTRPWVRASSPTTFWASRIGHPCARYLYHSWVDWDKAAPLSEGLLEVFAEGRAQERAVELALAEAGFRVLEGQWRIHLEDPPVSGRVEGRLVPEAPLPGWPVDNRGEPRSVLFEIKSVSPHAFASLNTLSDFLQSDRWYERMWPAQLQIYLWVLKEAQGVLLLKNKLRFELKEIWMDLDPFYVAGLLDRARDIYKAIVARTPPPRTEGEQCRDCEYQLVCRPEIYYGEGAQISDDQELAALLDRRAELLAAKHELDEIEEQIKKKLGDREIVICGDWLVEGKWVERRETVIPAGRYLRRVYKRMRGGGESEPQAGL